MSGIPSNVWTTVAILLVGYSLNIVRDLLREGQRDLHRRRREREAREFKQKARTEIRREAFRRKAVAELKERLSKYHHRICDPAEDDDLQPVWLNLMSQERQKMIVIASALNDPELEESLRKMSDQAVLLEARQIAGNDEGFSPDTCDNFEKFYEDATHRVYKLLCDAA